METEGVLPSSSSTLDSKMTNHPIDIYYFLGSGPCRAVLMLVKALGLNHNIKVVNLLATEQMSPDYIKLNPLHTVPTINDGGFVLCDSHVILKYLVDQYAKDDSLYPRDPKRGAIVNQRLYFDACCLFPRLLEYAMPVLFFDQPANIEKQKNLEEGLKIMDGFLINKSWLAGPYLTVADFSAVCLIATIESMGTFELKQFKNLWTWYQRTKNALTGYDYEEINQRGADFFGAVFKSKLK